MLQGDKGKHIDFERTAWHEAGHAALLLYFRRPIYGAWISRERYGACGEVRYLHYHFLPHVKRRREWLEAFWPKVVMLAWQEMAVAYAGVTAEEYVFGIDADTLFMDSSDEAWFNRQTLTVHNTEIALGFTHTGLNIFWPDVRADVRALLKQPDTWRAVKAIAHALLKKPSLTGKQIIAAVDVEFSARQQMRLFDVDEYLLPFYS